MQVRLWLDDCVARMATMPGDSVGGVVCDPPYGLEFMGKEWDRLDWQAGGGFSRPGIGERQTAWPSFSATTRFGAANPTCAVCGGRLRGAKKCSCPQPHDHWKPIGKRRNPENEGLPDTMTGGGMAKHLNAIAKWHERWVAEAFRILRPGGVLKAFSGTRTFHRLAVAMEAVGFEAIRIEAWGYGSGFPKSLNVSKAIDKAAGVDQRVHAEVQAYLKAMREKKGLSKSDVDKVVFGGTTRYSWVEGRGGARSNEVYLPTPEEWTRLKAVLDLDDRFDEYICRAIPTREHRFRADGGKGKLVAVEEGDWGYQRSGERWDGTRRVTTTATPEAALWEGWGTALKPAWEPVVVGVKPVGCPSNGGPP